MPVEVPPISETYTALNKRLVLFFRAIGKTISRVEVECGFSKGSLSVIVRQDRTILADRLVVILKTYPRLNGDWLLSGRGPMFITEVSTKIKTDTLEKVVLFQLQEHRNDRELIGDLERQLVKTLNL